MKKEIEEINPVKYFNTLLVCLLLAACGGGGGTNTGLPIAPPAATSSLAPQGQSIQTADGATGTLGFTVTVANLTASTATPTLTYDQAVLRQLGSIDTSVPGQYGVKFITAPNLAVGTYTGKITFQLCQETACGTPYAGTQQVFSYTANVKLADWTTYQRNAAHSGYVPASFDPSKFTQAWSWLSPSVGSITFQTSGAGNIYFATEYVGHTNKLIALNESSGNVAWQYTDLNASSLQFYPPAFSNGRVYVHLQNERANFITDELWSVDAVSGALLKSISTGNQGAGSFAPTIVGDNIYTNGGFDIGGITAFSISQQQQIWRSEYNNFDFLTPAADANHIYLYDGWALHILNPADGSTSKTIADPNAQLFCCSSQGSAYLAAPLLDSNGNIFALSGENYNATMTSSAAGYYARPITSFNVANGGINWSTWSSKTTYLSQPALANGVIYAGTANPARLDAIDAATGATKWSWTPTNGDKGFYHNVIVTNNLVFASTDQAVYALDLITHQVVWKFSNPGSLAISAGGYLIISTGGRVSDGGIVAIKIQ